MNKDIRYDMIVYNYDQHIIDFVHIGKLSLIDKIVNRARNFGSKKKHFYAIKAKNKEQFIDYLLKTNLDDKLSDYYSVLIKVTKPDIRLQLSFDDLLYYFCNEQKIKGEEREKFMHACQGIKLFACDKIKKDNCNIK